MVDFKLPNEMPHCRTLWIGVLQGTWKEMGIQYGQRCGKDIARNFDIAWKQATTKGKNLWQQGRTGKEKADYVVRYLQRCFKELSILSPEMTGMFNGIAQGAAAELDRCMHAKACTHFEKIGMLNYSSVDNLHPEWDFEKDRPAVGETGGRKAGPSPEKGDCNGFWVKGEATRTGHTYATRAAQSGHIEPGGSGKERQVSYVCIPKDPSARVFWGNGRAGNLGGIGGGLMNDCGLCCLTSGAQYPHPSRSYMDETMAPGIRDFLLASYGVIFSKTAKEAVERVTVGTENYRKLTGRKTVLRARGCNIVFADANDAFCVEQNARYYAIRRPGDLDEKNNDYLVHANHFKSKKGSFDENNIFHPEKSMSDFTPERKDISNGSYYRFWSGMWMIRNNYGRIDEKLLMEDLVASHYGYDEEGKRYDPDPETGVPTVGSPLSQGLEWHGSFCAHIKPVTPENPKGVGGNAETSVFDLSTREVWWVPVWPCHFKEWNLDWYYTDLKPFSEYRKILWGYK